MKNKGPVDPNAMKAFEQVKLEIAEEFGIADNINVGNAVKGKNKKLANQKSKKKRQEVLIKKGENPN